MHPYNVRFIEAALVIVVIELAVLIMLQVV